MKTRIMLHLKCPWRNWHETRFHLAGIVREFVPRGFQSYVH
ncbi:hypothetical protein [Luteolibacter marinus]|nr:hypothetical protein [Luteolibacter marinus]